MRIPWFRNELRQSFNLLRKDYFQFIKNNKILIAFLTFFKGITVLNFPLLVEGDGLGYNIMFQGLGTSLIHSPGYPLFFNILLFPFRIVRKFDNLLLDFLLYFGQQIFFVFSFSVFLYAAKNKVSKWALLLFTIILFGDYTLLSSSFTTRPEFTQASFILLMMGILFKLLSLENIKLRPSILFLLGLTTTFTFFVKYNAIALIPFSFILVVLSQRKYFYKKIFRILGPYFMGGLISFFFIYSFHMIKSKNWKPIESTGWIHIEKSKNVLHDKDFSQVFKPFFQIQSLAHSYGNKCEASFTEISRKDRSCFSKNNLDLKNSLESLGSRKNFDTKTFDYFNIYNVFGYNRTNEFFMEMISDLEKKYHKEYQKYKWTEFQKLFVSFTNERMGYPVSFKIKGSSWFPNIASHENETIQITDGQKKIDMNMLKERWDFFLVRGDPFVRVSTIKAYLFLSWPSYFIVRPEIFWAASLIFLLILPLVRLSFAQNGMVFFSLGSLVVVSYFSSKLMGFRIKEYIFCFPFYALVISLSFDALLKLVSKYLFFIKKVI